MSMQVGRQGCVGFGSTASAEVLDVDDVEDDDAGVASSAAATGVAASAKISSTRTRRMRVTVRWSYAGG